ncbi:alpha-mannosidase [Pedobacter yulinensis]|uniref:Alpha-mannosidase n=1 Tax=Pedobacter yulinensis TaxID=2126353 RepID=A0A2T3HHF4_9SPHI|nr:GH92 family glycosyl hydrolase [Pedobacter yulinensis]PST81833.1 alpha-mannosidase [Pedobacter yulinensis]
MKKRHQLILLPLLFSLTTAAQQYTKLVEPRIGTAHSRWFFFTPGAAPFGMAKPGPSTNGSEGNAQGWEAVGYDYRHTSIEGFANFHEFQIGGVVFAPSTGELKTTPGKLDDVAGGYRSDFDRRDEQAYAGYYSVLLKKYGIRAELTATPRVAFHRYTFPESRQANILFDIGNKQGESGEVKGARVEIMSDGRIEGYVVTRPVYVSKYQPGAEVAMFFSAVADKRPLAVGSFNGRDLHKGTRSAKGKGAGVYLTFSTKAGEKITIKAGLSYTSIENARKNLQAEAHGLTFDQALKQSQASWNEALGRIAVKGGKQADQVKFYTALYHALLGRGLASDVNGAYPRNDGSTGQIPLAANGKPLHNHYNTDAIWGGFWNLTQLWTLAYPEYYSDFIKSQLLVYKDSGWLADGIANSRYVSGVGTNFVGLVMASAYCNGIRDFDTDLAWQAAYKNEVDGKNRPRGAGKLDVARFVKKGYVGHIDKSDDFAESWQFSASHTLEYAYSAYAMAEWARLLGKATEEKQFNRLAAGWKELFDDKLKLVRPKYDNGKFIDNFNPSEVWRGFQEGNAWQYTFYVPQDPQGLITRIGRNAFNKRLDSIFAASQQNAFGGGKTLDAFSGLQAPYNHGNQPNLHISWLFNYSGRPSLTQKWVRAICDEFYGSDGIHGYGYGQDEDQGQLGAWYVLAAMGLFDVQGMTNAHGTMGISTPLFKEVQIKLNKKYHSGEAFKINCENFGEGQRYISQIIANGRKLEQPFVPVSDILRGGTLQLRLSAEPRDQF